MARASLLGFFFPLFWICNHFYTVPAFGFRHGDSPSDEFEFSLPPTSPFPAVIPIPEKGRGSRIKNTMIDRLETGSTQLDLTCPLSTYVPRWTFTQYYVGTAYRSRYTATSRPLPLKSFDIYVPCIYPTLPAFCPCGRQCGQEHSLSGNLQERLTLTQNTFTCNSRVTLHSTV